MIQQTLDTAHPRPAAPTTDLALILLWEHARHAEQRILADVREQFELLETIEVTWQLDTFGANLSRFYGTLLPPGSDKEAHCGTGPFLAIIVRDPAPTFEARPTSKGLRQVAKRIFDSKTRYRKWTGGGHRVHASNNPLEAVHDLHLLLGIDFEQDPLVQLRSLSGSGTFTRDLPGTGGWESTSELFKAMNHAITYVVLRNFDHLPAENSAPGHDDVDLLVASFADALHVLDARLTNSSPRRVQATVSVGSRDMLFDLRYPGDRYLPKVWAENVLASRVRLASGIYVPDPENHFFALLYHALVHKGQIAADYLVRLKTLATSLRTEATVDALGQFMAERGYELAPPLDESVGFHAPRALLEKVPSARAARWRLVRDHGKQVLKRGLAALRLIEIARAIKRRLSLNRT